MAASESFTKTTRRIRHPRVGAGDSNPLRYHKWFESLKLGEAPSDYDDFMVPQGLVVPKVQLRIAQESGKSRRGGVVAVEGFYWTCLIEEEKTMKTRFLAVGMMLAGLGAATAWADIFTFSTSGTTSGGSVSGSATFDISSSAMTITLANTGPIASIAQVLDGLAFTLSGPVTGLALTSVSANGFETCIGSGNSTTCGAGGTGTSPYGWTISGLNPYLLSAGDGSFKPYGIVNTGITGADGLGDLPHNPYLIGPVVYNFTFSTAPTDVDAATFYWGTIPETTPGVPNVPDGGVTLMLLGGALVGLETLRRRIRA
jgi:hypothetical protein